MCIFSTLSNSNKCIRFFSKGITTCILLWFSLFSSNCFAELHTQDMQLSTYYQTDESLSAEAVLQQNFIPINNQAVTPVDKTAWIKIEWNKNKITNETHLINDFVSQAYEDYYLIKDNTIIHTASSGHARPFDIRPNENFKFSVNTQDADFVLLKSCCSVSFPAYFRYVSPRELKQHYYQELVWYIAVYAIVLTMLLYNFFIFLYLKNKQFLYYCLYLVMMLIMQLRLSGIGKQFLWPNLTETVTFDLSNSMLIAITSMIFQQSFLNQHYFSNIRKRVFPCIILLTTIPFIIYCLRSFIPYAQEIGHIGSQTMLVVTILATNYVIIGNLLAGDRSARILLFAYSFMSVAGGIAELRYNGMVADNFWFAHCIDIAVVFEALVLAFALAEKIQTLKIQKTQKEISHRKLLQDFSQQLLSVQETERKKISHTLQQKFTHQIYLLKHTVEQHLGITENSKKIEQLLYELHDLSGLLRPSELDSHGLAHVLQGLITEIHQYHDLTIELTMADIELTESQSVTVYRIIQECLNNVLKHANACNCHITLKPFLTHSKTTHSKNRTDATPMLQLKIKDDGTGFDIQQHTHSLGLTSIKERTNMLGGSYRFKSNHLGTSISIRFPIISPITDSSADTLVMAGETPL